MTGRSPVDPGPAHAEPNEETRVRLVAAAKLLTEAAAGNRLSVVVAVEGARRLLDRALDAETGTLDVPLEGGPP